MTPDQVRLIRESWLKVQPISDTAAERFYARRCELEPSVPPLCKRPLAEQGPMLMSALRMIVMRLEHLDQLVPGIRALGARHAGYGVRDEHYAVVGEALLWTLEQGLGPDFDDATREAWATAYGVLAATMQEAARMATEAQAA